ncbi:MAG: hypothetical protein A2X35_00370 [Elusimicrobia bacterium GWA2_61_42]|nr:MAG: hypothetical protein A2X35_00370 [Elusimicrobia bacterium GWA2_61_42]OGR74549.1 MAG: hypothetical protein A2X38_08120 [Elusimicrobia bacterium GWC2_61_25]
MRYFLILLLAAFAAPVRAQNTPPPVADKDIRLQTPEELTRTAASLEEAVRLKPADVDLQVKLGFTYTRLGKADEAQKAFESAAALDPKKAIAHYMLGLIYEKKELKDKAVAAWKACLASAAEPRLRETALKHLNNLTAR